MRPSDPRSALTPCRGATTTSRSSIAPPCASRPGLKRAIQRVGLDAPGEFVAIINAIDMQLESGRPVVATVAHLADAFCDLALARGVDVFRIRLTDHINELLHHLGSTTPQTR